MNSRLARRRTDIRPLVVVEAYMCGWPAAIAAAATSRATTAAQCSDAERSMLRGGTLHALRRTPLILRFCSCSRALCHSLRARACKRLNSCAPSAAWRCSRLRSQRVGMRARSAWRNAAPSPVHRASLLRRVAVPVVTVPPMRAARCRRKQGSMRPQAADRQESRLRASPQGRAPHSSCMQRAPQEGQDAEHTSTRCEGTKQRQQKQRLASLSALWGTQMPPRLRSAGTRGRRARLASCPPLAGLARY